MPQDAVTYPLGPPSISGTTYTVDFLLNNPTRVTHVVADLVMAQFFLDDIFTTGGDVQGGAVLYDQPVAADTYLAVDIERVEPGDEFPIVDGQRTAPKLATPEEFGGKFPTLDKARIRNDITRYNNNLRRLSNTIVRKMHQRGLAELAAAISANSRTAATIGWVGAMALTGTTRAPGLMPMRSLAAAIRESDVNEMGYDYDTLVVNPIEAEALRVCYGSELANVLSDSGISKLISTNRKATNSVYVLASGQVGEMRIEEPLETVVEREGAPQLRKQTWTQSSVSPVFLVTDPFAIIELTGTGS